MPPPGQVCFAHHLLHHGSIQELLSHVLGLVRYGPKQEYCPQYVQTYEGRKSRTHSGDIPLCVCFFFSCTLCAVYCSIHSAAAAPGRFFFRQTVFCCARCRLPDGMLTATVVLPGEGPNTFEALMKTTQDVKNFFATHYPICFGPKGPSEEVAKAFLGQR